MCAEKRKPSQGNRGTGATDPDTCTWQRLKCRQWVGSFAEEAAGEAGGPLAVAPCAMASSVSPHVGGTNRKERSCRVSIES